MSIADAVRVRELEARVAILEAKIATLEHRVLSEQSNNGTYLAQRINLLQGQINGLRRASGEVVKTDNAA